MSHAVLKISMLSDDVDLMGPYDMSVERERFDPFSMVSKFPSQLFIIGSLSMFWTIFLAMLVMYSVLYMILPLK